MLSPQIHAVHRAADPATLSADPRCKDLGRRNEKTEAGVMTGENGHL